MFSNFTEEARKTIVNAKEEMYELKHPYVGSEHLLLAILKTDNPISKKLKTFNLTYDVLKKEIIKIIGIGSKKSEWFLYTPLLKRILENASVDSKENNNGEVTINHLFSSLLEEGEGVAIRIMLSLNIDIDELYSEFTYNIKSHSKNQKLLLEQMGVDLTKKALNNEIDPVVGREKEITRVLEILSRRCKNNPLLIGEAGVGKTAIVEELARRIAFGEVPISLKNKRIISLDMATSVAGTKYRGEFEERMRTILKEIEENDDIILFIDEIHTLVGAGGAEGAIDASNIFKPALARNKIRCIGATTISEYKKFISEDKALERRFQKVMIDIPDKDTIKEILLKMRDIYSEYHSVKISDEMLDLIIELSNKYLYERKEPDKTIDLMDEVCSSVSLKEDKDLKKYNELNRELQKIINDKNEAILENNFTKAANYKIKENSLMNKINNLELSLHNKKAKEVTKEDIAKVINFKTKIPVYEILKENGKIVEKIRNDLSREIIGQDEAIAKTINIAKRIKLGFNDNKCYSVLFCGPSGIGKTKLAKVFGTNLVGENNIIKLDMSEYSEASSVSKIVGSPPGYVGYNDNHFILEEIKNKPYSVLILDEIERANLQVINLFFQILDDSKIKDSKGEIVRFDNVTIIMTSNIGFSKQAIGFKQEDKVISKLKENFSVPFINRIDDIVIFNTLTSEDIKKILKQKIKLLKQKYQKYNLNLKVSSKVIDQIVELSNYQEFGARKLDKIIKEKLDSIIIENLINEKTNLFIKSLDDKIIV